MSAKNHTTVTQILDKMSVIALDCSIWSGARRLKPEDLVLGKGGQLPSDEVVSLGSKKAVQAGSAEAVPSSEGSGVSVVCQRRSAISGRLCGAGSLHFRFKPETGSGAAGL